MRKIRGFELVSYDNRKNTWKGDVHELPTRSTKNSAGYDFVLPSNTCLLPHSQAIVWSDVKAYMKKNEMLELHVRSSIGKKGIILSNCTGIIDSDYYDNPDNEGNICFMLYNLTDDVINLKAGTKIMQGIFRKYLIADNDNVKSIRVGGLGSTGK